MPVFRPSTTKSSVIWQYSPPLSARYYWTVCPKVFLFLIAAKAVNESFFSFFLSVPQKHLLQSKIKHELFMSSRSHSVILTLAPLNLVQFIFSLFLFNFYLSFLVAIIKMLKIKDKLANILKLFSSVEKMETPPICMTVYYKIKSIVT